MFGKFHNKWPRRAGEGPVEAEERLAEVLGVAGRLELCHEVVLRARIYSRVRVLF